MNTVNKVIIIGHLGRNPETRYTPVGDCVCHLTVATSEKWTDKASGTKKEITEWHRVVLFRKLGEIASQYLRKGAHVYVEGRLQTRKWADSSGNDRYTTEIVADQMHMLGSKSGAHDTEHDDVGVNDGADNPAAYADAAPQPAPAIERARTPVKFADEIPF